MRAVFASNGSRFFDIGCPVLIVYRVYTIIKFWGVGVKCDVPRFREASDYNRALLHAAQEETPDGMTIELFEIGELPFYNQSRFVAGPEVLVANAPSKFDDGGRLTDEKTRGFIRKHLRAVAEKVRRVERERVAAA